MGKREREPVLKDDLLELQNAIFSYILFDWDLGKI